MVRFPRLAARAFPGRAVVPLVLAGLVLTLPAIVGAKTSAPAETDEAPAPRKSAEAKAKTPAAGLLTGASAAQATARLGAPDLDHAEAGGALWTYRLEHCALLLAFKQSPKGLRVVEAFAGVRRRGETPLPLAACIAEAEARRRTLESPQP